MKAIHLLNQWGLWVWSDKAVNLGAQSAMRHVMALVQPARRTHVTITHDDAVRVDRVVARLRLHSETLHEIICLVFLRDYGMRQVALHLDISRDAAAKQFEYACGWVDGALQGDIEPVQVNQATTRQGETRNK